MSIEAVGAVCPLGLDLPNAAAAWRAGLTRGAPADDFSVRDPDSATGAGVTTHAVPIIGHGFEGVARLARLVEGAIVDLRRRTDDTFWQRRLAFLLVMPHPQRRYLTSALVVDEDHRQQLEEEARSLPQITDDMLAPIVQQALAVADVPRPPIFVKAYRQGSVGVVHALRSASILAGSDKYDAALVCCVDSFLDFRTLAWLEGINRLQTPDMSAGMQPGEAAALVALAPPSKSSGGLQLRLAASANEERSFASGRSSVGGALAECLKSAREDSRERGVQGVWLLADLNGEVYRAQEWGHTLVRLRGTDAAFDEPEAWFPATGTGNVGAAFPGLTLGLIQQAVERGYAPSGDALICFGDDHGPRGAIAISASGAPL